jgi:hypothetical protein
MQNRKKDFLESGDFGIVYNTSWRPNFEFYVDTLSTVISLGGGYVKNAKMIGMAHGRAGTFDKNAWEWGVMAWGVEERGVGEFDPNDMYDAGDRYKDATDWPVLDHGWFGSWKGERPIPKWQFGQCSRGIHMGWLGLEMSSRAPEMIDFFLGWTTYDLMKDDLKSTGTLAADSKKEKD